MQIQFFFFSIQKHFFVLTNSDVISIRSVMVAVLTVLNNTIYCRNKLQLLLSTHNIVAGPSFAFTDMTLMQEWMI